MRKLGLVVLLGAVAGAAWQACKSPAAPGGILLMGSWGSEQGRLTATQVSTQFNGACGAGNTSEPILLDKKGRFNLVGVYGASGGAQSAARFKGSVGSEKIMLRVLLSDSSEAVAPVELHLGQQPALASCH